MKNDVNLIFHFHNEIDLPKARIRRHIKKIMCRLAFRHGALVCVSNGVSESVKKVHRLFPPFVIVNGISTDRLEEIGEQSYIDISGKWLTMIVFGNHYMRKGVDIAVRALERFNKDHPHMGKLYVCTDFAEEADHFIRGIAARGGDDIELIPTRNDIASYYNRADVFLSPSRAEGFRLKRHGAAVI